MPCYELLTNEVGDDEAHLLSRHAALQALARLPGIESDEKQEVEEYFAREIRAVARFVAAAVEHELDRLDPARPLDFRPRLLSRIYPASELIERNKQRYDEDGRSLASLVEKATREVSRWADDYREGELDDPARRVSPNGMLEYKANEGVWWLGPSFEDTAYSYPQAAARFRGTFGRLPEGLREAAAEPP